MEVTGKLVKKLQAESGTSKAGKPWEKQTVIIDNGNEFNNLISEGLYETVGGYIINKIGRIPHKNEHLFLTAGHVIIKKASSRRIEQIQIFKN